jgi:hypothetical protein
MAEYVTGRNTMEDSNIMWSTGREYYVTLTEDKQHWLTV